MAISFTRRKAFALAFAAAGFPTVQGKEVDHGRREWSFELTRFTSLTLKPDADGYRICVVQGGKDGEFMRTSFVGFKLLAATPTTATYEQRYDYPYQEGEEQHIHLALVKTGELGVWNSRQINYGHWKLSVTGAGARYIALKELILGNRVSELWIPENSMELRGSPMEER